MPVAVGEVQGTEERLLECSLRLFARQGYEGASVREIIEDVGVTRPVLYYYFRNKEDLYAKVVRTQLETIIAQIDAMIAEATGCRERLRGVIGYAFTVANERPDVPRLLLRVFFGSGPDEPSTEVAGMGWARMGRMARIMSDGMAEGVLGDADPLSLAIAFNGMMDMHVMARLHQLEAELSAELADELVELFIEGAGSGGKYIGHLDSPFEIESRKG